MKKTTVVFLITLVPAICFIACDKIEPPYKVDTGVGAGDSTLSFPVITPPVMRKLLIEDYTGIRCGTCPPASVTLYGPTGIKQQYGDTVVTLAIHASSGSQFTAPLLPDFPQDFRTPAGEIWWTAFNFPGNPYGMVSRINYPSSHQLAHTAWGGAVNSILTANPYARAAVQIINVYDSSSNNLSTYIKTTFLDTISASCNLVVLLFEDSIQTNQKDNSLPPPGIIFGYWQRHVMRGAVNSEWGVQLNAAPVVSGDTARNSYVVNLLNLPSSVNSTAPVLNLDKCYVVAFVFNSVTKEILQVEIAKVK